MDIKNVLVIGAGQMGLGIAQVFMTSNYHVSLYDMSEEQIKKGIAFIDKQLNRQVEKAAMTKVEKDEVMNRLYPISSLSNAAQVDLVVEAVVEKMEVKQSLFKELDQLMPPHTILATNTSSLPITEIAAATSRPQQVIGMHFMNPVPVMKLVEIIRGLATSDEVYKVIQDRKSVV